VGQNKNADDEELKTELAKAAEVFKEVQKVKKDDLRLRDFKTWTGNLEAAFNSYKSTPSYAKIQKVIEDNIETNQKGIVFHEANSCPEFWENTRLVTGLNVAETLLRSAQSLL
jgi:L-fucose isomerase-like protein